MHPFKIIYKLNDIQQNPNYFQFIFFYSKIPKDIKGILNTIKDLTYKETLLKLSKEQFQRLTDVFTENWYKYLFNKHHLLKSIRQMNNDRAFLNLLKIDKNWIKKHIIEYEEKKINIYSFLSDISYEKNTKNT